MAPNRSPDLNILLLPFHEGMAKISHEQHNQILTNAHYATLQLDLAAIYPLLRAVNCKKLFHLDSRIAKANRRF